MPAVLANSSGFVYYVSIAGITGTAAPDIGAVERMSARIKAQTDLPIAVGFGVKTRSAGEGAGGTAEGVVVGSALVSALAQSLDQNGQAPREPPRTPCWAWSSGLRRRSGIGPKLPRFRL